MNWTFAGLAAMLVVISGCAMFRAVPRSDSDPPTRQQVDEASPPQLLLDAAEKRIATGDLVSASEALERLIELHARAPQAAQALFQLAALQWNPANPGYDPATALLNLRRIVDEYPQSPWAPAAAAVVELSRDRDNLQAVVNALQQQLEALKQLDLGPRG